METVDIQSLEINDDDWILDLGCGEGRHSIACQFHFSKSKVIGLDLDFPSLKKARHKQIDFMGKLKNTCYIQGSGYALPFSDKSFDHIICAEVLEHIPEYENFLHEIRRVLKPNGYLSLSVPRAWPETICWRLSPQYHQVEGGHIRIFNAANLERELMGFNFLLLKKQWAHALHSPYWWLRCLWWRNGDENPFSRLYHKLLVWDLIKKPIITRIAEKLLNPIMGKSVVFYLQKNPASE